MGKKILNRFLMAGIFVVLLLTPMVKVEAKQIQEVTVDTKTKDFDKALRIALDTARYNKDKNLIFKIIIPPGNYTVKENLNLYSNTWLVMDGVTLTRKFGGCLIRFGRGSEVTKASGYSAFENITIEGGTLDGNGKNNVKYTASLLRFAHSKNITIKNVTFTNVRNGHHVEFSASKDVVVENCTFKNYCGKTTKNSEALQIEINNKNHFGAFGKYDETICKNITVKNCTFKKVQRGVGTHAGIAGSYFQNIVIENNKFQNIPGYAIMATNYANSKITGNIMTDVAAGICFRNLMHEASTYYAPANGKVKIVKNSASEISGNTIEITDKGYNNAIYGIQLYGEKLKKKTKGIPKGDYRVYKVKVKDNNITMKNNGFGVVVEGAVRNNISENTINMATVKNAKGKAGGIGILVKSGSKNSVNKNKVVNSSKNKKSKKYEAIRISGKTIGTAKSNKFVGYKKKLRVVMKKY